MIIMSLNNLQYKDDNGILFYVRKEIIDFAIEMEKVMKQNDISKKDFWKTCDLKILYKKRDDQDVDWFGVKIESSSEEIINLLIDQANYNMMIFNRIKKDLEDSKIDCNPENYF